MSPRIIIFFFTTVNDFFLNFDSSSHIKVSFCNKISGEFCLSSYYHQPSDFGPTIPIFDSPPPEFTVELYYFKLFITPSTT